MDTFGDDYQFFWESSMLLPSNEELDSWGLEEALSASYYDSSSPDGAASSLLASKNIVSERNRRKKLNERLFALRSVVPNITKLIKLETDMVRDGEDLQMDKASIIKDAIGYIQELHEEEKRIKADISELGHLTNGHDFSVDVDQRSPVLKSKKKRTDNRRQCCNSNGNANSNGNGCSKSSPIQDLEMRVSYVGERTVVVSLTCGKREGTMVKLCEIFESLKLKIITAHITAFSGRLLKTVFVEADEVEKDHLRIQIETVISSCG